MSRLATEAPAKLNLALEVVGRRDDGFHELWTVFDAIDLCDRLDYEPGDGAPRLVLAGGDPASGAPRLVLAGGDPASGAPEGDDNLVLRAARTFAEATGLPSGGTWTLTKAVPAGAGLGGGSSDAAAALRLLCERHGRDPTAPDVAALARGLGADVPFFLHGGRAWADGRGDRIHPLPGGPRFAYLLLHPGRPLATAAVFARCAAGERGGFTDPPHDLSSPSDRSAEAAAERSGREVAAGRDEAAARGLCALLARTGEAGPWAEGLFNDLERAAQGAAPWLDALRLELLRQGFPRFHLSGSGSTLFVAATDPRPLAELGQRLGPALARPPLADLAPGAVLLPAHSRA
ncbi:MAG: 4-(cytidine 5'-diphospho)-2-C-methyl-D-erythritol kinase [Planctomycetota bacterium]